MRQTEVQVPRFNDQQLVCVDCGQTFTFNAGEQSFYWRKGLCPPKRCPGCRAVRKATIAPNEGQ